MRGPSLCCCCCCAALSLWGVCACVCMCFCPSGFNSERQAEKHQYHSSILQWESPNTKYSSVPKITAKLWQFQWFIYSRVEAVKEMKGCMCVGVCVDGSVGHESKLHENINTFDPKSASISFLRAGFKGIFGGLCVHVGDGGYCCDERKQSQRKSNESPFKKQ